MERRFHRGNICVHGAQSGRLWRNKGIYFTIRRKVATLVIAYVDKTLYCKGKQFLLYQRRKITTLQNNVNKWNLDCKFFSTTLDATHVFLLTSLTIAFIITWNVILLRAWVLRRLKCNLFALIYSLQVWTVLLISALFLHSFILYNNNRTVWEVILWPPVLQIFSSKKVTYSFFQNRYRKFFTH